MREYLEDISKNQIICIKTLNPECKCYRCRDYRESSHRKTEKRKMKRDKKKGFHRKVC